MKIKLMVSEENYSQIFKELTAMGVEIDDGAQLILSEKNVYVSRLIGRHDNEIFRLNTKDISHIESFAHDIIAHCGGDEYKLTERLRRLEKKTLSVEEKMEEIRVVNRAKWLLISALQMEEPQAHRYIEKQAMDHSISKREVAEEIIRTYT